MVEIFHGYGNISERNAFYDEEGVYHCHNGNVDVSVFRCSNGHETKSTHYTTCQCGFAAGESRMETVEDYLKDHIL